MSVLNFSVSSSESCFKKTQRGKEHQTQDFKMLFQKPMRGGCHNG